MQIREHKSNTSLALVALELLKPQQNASTPKATNTTPTPTSALILPTIAQKPSIVFDAIYASPNGRNIANSLLSFYECDLYKKVALRFGGIQTSSCPNDPVSTSNSVAYSIKANIQSSYIQSPIVW